MTRIDRRSFLLVAAGAAAGAAAVAATPAFVRRRDLVWHDVTAWGVEGRAWDDTERYFDRLPAKARDVVRDPVWNLSRDSAGMLARFTTDATEIHIRYALRSASLAMPHMPATGVSGFDLYAADETGRPRWLAAAKPTAQSATLRLIDAITPGARLYTLYLPLYNGVDALEIGVPAGAAFAPAPPRPEPPVVVYGTSIAHGGCASRPGMGWPAIVGRRLDRPVVNLGFSGNGTMDPEMAELLAEISAAAYVIDCLPNMRAQQVSERTVPLVRTIREARPATPIVLVEDRTFANAWLRPGVRRDHDARRAELRRSHQQLLDAGVQHLYYVTGDDLIGTDSEATVDGSHPTDLGMVRYADVMTPVLARILGT